jgi:hypothetical protein
MPCTCTHVHDRADAICHRGRKYVPTIEGQTKWVSTLQEFVDAGGIFGWNDDQTEVTLYLPPPFKISCQMFREVTRSKVEG